MNVPTPTVDFHAHASIPEIEGTFGDGPGPQRKRESDAAYSGARFMKHFVAMLGDGGAS